MVDNSACTCHSPGHKRGRLFCFDWEGTTLSRIIPDLIPLIDSYRRLEKPAFKNSYNLKFSFGPSGKFARAEGVAVDEHGSCWIADTYGNRVQIYDRDGNFVKLFGQQGVSLGEFRYPSLLTFGLNGDLIVSEDDRVQVFDAKTCDFKAEFHKDDDESGQFDCPTDITTDSVGNTLVVDWDTRRSQVVTPNGAYFMDFGKNITEGLTRKLEDVQALAVDPVDGTIILCTENRIYMCDPFTGGLIREFGEDLHDAIALETDRDGHVLVVDEGPEFAKHGSVQIFTKQGQFLMKFGEGILAKPTAVALNKEGDIFVLDWNSNVFFFFLNKFINKVQSQDY